MSTYVVIETFGKSRVTKVLHKGSMIKSKTRLNKDPIDFKLKFGQSQYLIEVGDKLDYVAPVTSTVYTERGYTVMVQDTVGIDKHIVNIYYGPENVILPNTYKGFGIGSDNLEILSNVIWRDLCFLALLIQTFLLFFTLYLMDIKWMSILLVR
jgi:hypothetical protein